MRGLQGGTGVGGARASASNIYTMENTFLVAKSTTQYKQNKITSKQLPKGHNNALLSLFCFPSQNLHYDNKFFILNTPLDCLQLPQHLNQDTEL